MRVKFRIGNDWVVRKWREGRKGKERGIIILFTIFPASDCDFLLLLSLFFSPSPFLFLYLSLALSLPPSLSSSLSSYLQIAESLLQGLNPSEEDEENYTPFSLQWPSSSQSSPPPPLHTLPKTQTATVPGRQFYFHSHSTDVSPTLTHTQKNRYREQSSLSSLFESRVLVTDTSRTQPFFLYLTCHHHGDELRVCWHGIASEG